MFIGGYREDLKKKKKKMKANAWIQNEAATAVVLILPGKLVAVISDVKLWDFNTEKADIKFKAVILKFQISWIVSLHI